MERKSEKKADRQTKPALSRRELLRAAGVATVALPGLALGVEARQESPQTLTLPLDLSQSLGLELFLRALEDADYRKSVRNMSGLPPVASELLQMLDDQGFATMVSETVASLDGYLRNTTTLDSVQSRASAVDRYLSETYPVAFEALRSYAYAALPRHQFEVERAKELFAKKGDPALSLPSFCNPFVYVCVAVAVVAIVAVVVAVVAVLVAVVI